MNIIFKNLNPKIMKTVKYIYTRAGEIRLIQKPFGYLVSLQSGLINENTYFENLETANNFFKNQIKRI